ncbi:hypothetical protein B0H13DRAFT_2560641 [Mycena leptocephala]|nr:hypothetical protein B0H13DRAFT_2560641 [Mycena leptocephala]
MYHSPSIWTCAIICCLLRRRITPVIILLLSQPISLAIQAVSLSLPSTLLYSPPPLPTPAPTSVSPPGGPSLAARRFSHHPPDPQRQTSPVVTVWLAVFLLWPAPSGFIGSKRVPSSLVLSSFPPPLNPLQRKLVKDGIFASMGPLPFYGVISFCARSSQIVSEFIPGLLINGP